MGRQALLLAALLVVALRGAVGVSTTNDDVSLSLSCVEPYPYHTTDALNNAVEAAASAVKGHLGVNDCDPTAWTAVRACSSAPGPIEGLPQEVEVLLDVNYECQLAGKWKSLQAHILAVVEATQALQQHTGPAYSLKSAKPLHISTSGEHSNAGTDRDGNSSGDSATDGDGAGSDGYNSHSDGENGEDSDSEESARRRRLLRRQRRRRRSVSRKSRSCGRKPAKKPKKPAKKPTRPKRRNSRSPSPPRGRLRNRDDSPNDRRHAARSLLDDLPSPNRYSPSRSPVRHPPQKRSANKKPNRSVSRSPVRHPPQKKPANKKPNRSVSRTPVRHPPQKKPANKKPSRSVSRSPAR